MAAAATRFPALRRPGIGDVRIVRIVLTAIVAAGLQLAALRLPLPTLAGADLADPTQRIYALNIWQETQISLLLLLIFLPWLLYALLWKGSRLGAAVLGSVALLGTLAAMWLTLLSLQSYRALPRSVNAVVARVDGRQLSLRNPSERVYLAVTDAELASARSWLKPGAGISLWVSPRGHAGYLAPADVAA